MLFIPLPFVVAVLMLVIAVQKLRRTESPDRAFYLFTALMLAYGLQSIIIGLRWGYNLIALMPVQAVLATAIAALAYLAFQSLTDDPARQTKAQYLHGLPAALVAIFYVTARPLIGPFIMLTFLAYGLALISIARRGPDALVATRLDGAILSWRALWITAITLILSALTDLAISLDLSVLHGNHAATIISGANLVAVLLLGTAAAFAGESSDDQEPAQEEDRPDSPSTGPTQQDRAIAAELEALMATKALYKDTELNLSRLARRLGRPARQVSQAINRTHGISVSHYVNNLRIAEACRLLEHSHDNITRLMFDAGFISKSNFNREFLRVTGTSPTIWRQRQAKPVASATKIDSFSESSGQVEIIQPRGRDHR
jgi:AraC-like DNA-binding protein